jgi:hypothetical protein
MGKDSPAPPATPDYSGAAAAQGAANIDTARVSAKLSNPNIYGPLGSQTITYGTGDQQDIPTVTQTLTPDAQATLEAQQRVQKGLAGLGEQGISRVGDVVGQDFNPNLPGLQTSVNQGPATNKGPAMGLYGDFQQQGDLSNVAAMPVNAGTTGQEAIMARLQPQIERNRELKQTQLRNQGLVAGGEAYDADMKNLGQQENDLYSQAALNGIGLDMSANNQGYTQAMQNASFANQGLGQQYGQAAQSAGLQNAGQAQDLNSMLQSAQFGNTAQQQSLAQQLQLRNQPLNEITGLMSGSQIQTPQFQQYQGQNIAPPPIFGATQAAGAGAMQNYGIQQAGVNAQNAGLYGLGGAGLMAGALANKSDRRLKSNVVRVGEYRGIGLYEYDIEDRREIGVMADEAREIAPHAVIRGADGFDSVFYGELGLAGPMVVQ